MIIPKNQDSKLSSKITLILLYYDTKKTCLSAGRFTSKFKTKVVLEAMKERQTVKELAQKFEITPQQIGIWKRDFLKEADTVFSKGEKSKKSEEEEKRPAS